MTTKPRYDPCPCLQLDLEHPSFEGWIPILQCQADFSVDIFEAAVGQMIDHPEYNSTLILRSETLETIDSHQDSPQQAPTFPHHPFVRAIRRKLLARRPGRDASIDQLCSFYSSSLEEELPADTVVLTPLPDPGTSLPYYHPAVEHLAIRYIHSDPPSLRIELIPLEGIPFDLNSRLYRTSLALLETVHRYGWGAITNYQKRVNHDRLVPRERYQDLYLIMRERHKHLVDTWKEVTDPLKHVFEDIGIATFLMLLWKDSFPSSGPETGDEPWRAWGRPPGGFLDFGCGNGLLTHILVSEGYEGIGIDLRARMSWEHYPPSTQTQLQVHAFDPTVHISTTSEPPAFFNPGTFIIGNHADELTPWIPLLATARHASGYISIPCCSWSFDTKFERGMIQGNPYPIPIPTKAHTSKPDGISEEIDFTDSLHLGGGPGSGSSGYSVYRVWLSALSLFCGWQVETEVLRIPSTRNWALVGRKRRTDMQEEHALDNITGLIGLVKRRDLFKTRTPEGKGGDH